ncbi:Rpn family recombination-promoting nuclease/putative transposase [Pseudogracilibacillus sp. SO30301A]|uniref:Rpn family recombination-promoting nuclease/putative transposase n=1 Tax=Pseudogracilibacillus sp. SO30301A TaxID=3098291 RepID=UPI00300DCB6D
MSISIFPNLVRESSSQYTKHDQLFKQLIHTFFEEFLEAFFPEIHKQIDFQSTVQLSEEFFTDLIDGDVRRLDIIVQARIIAEESLIIIHIEPQSSVQTNFHERMFQYFSLLYHKFRKPIIPIAVYSYKENWDLSQFNIHFLDKNILKFNYFALHLRKQNWREYIKKDNPAAAALLSKMGYSEEERIQVKIEFLRMLVRLRVDPAKQRLLYGFFESYLSLNDEEEERFMEEARRLDEADEILEIPISYEERGKKKGLEEGLERGKKEVALKLLKKGLDIYLIMEATKLSLDEIKKLQKQLEK